MNFKFVPMHLGTTYSAWTAQLHMAVDSSPRTMENLDLPKSQGMFE
ncbi:hypothetical protein BRADI_3g23377v3 [Brachypodium distachyon]|uniref:Uncharacterized protein n=1 Tax=Brachypodium distachyon TaxID=15368 RepID=A0A0Q3HSJ6_BRADI|nr:hypothetical protein BRADI_3g23377v3 [Brachypodium distachyon]